MVTYRAHGQSGGFKNAAFEVSTFSLRSAGSAVTNARRKWRDEGRMDSAAPDPLKAIRSRIDEIDERMHRLLIERSGVIAELIRIKGLSKPGAAFRPEREADMMRRLAARHEGSLPLATVEHIWREIITTFTAMQAPFGIAVGPCDDPLAMRDLVRFYFGFSIPVTNCATNEAAIARVAASGMDVAVVAGRGDGRWWDFLGGPQAPKIFAKLPFIEMPFRPAALAAYVIGPPIKDDPHPDIRVFAAPADVRLEEAIRAKGGQVAVRCGDRFLFELPAKGTFADNAASGATLDGSTEIGGFFKPLRVSAETSR
jgi:chorismate mutase